MAEPCVVRFGKGVSLTHEDNPLAGRFLTEDDLAGGRPKIDAPLPVRAKALGTDEAEEKASNVNPLSRVTGGAVAPRGDENHATLTRNPYAGTPDAASYENGYEYAQQLGHQVLGQISTADLAKWQRAAPAWRAGLADGAKTLGIGSLAATLNNQGKTAGRFLATEYVQMKIAESARV